MFTVKDFDIFFRTVGIFTCSFSLSFFIVALYVKKDKYIEGYEEEVEEEEVEEEEEVNYKDKYYSTFHELDNTKLTDGELKNLKEKYLYEQTPEGEVIMHYNMDTESFVYWSDKNKIPFFVLDAVSQKYAIEFNCKSICVDYKHENSLKQLKEIEKKIEKKEKGDKVYVKFKNYKTNNRTLLKKSNIFRYNGDIDEYYKNKNKDKNKDKNIKDINYSDFKKSYK